MNLQVSIRLSLELSLAIFLLVLQCCSGFDLGYGDQTFGLYNRKSVSMQAVFRSRVAVPVLFRSDKECEKPPPLDYRLHYSSTREESVWPVLITTKGCPSCPEYMYDVAEIGQNSPLTVELLDAGGRALSFCEQYITGFYTHADDSSMTVTANFKSLECLNVFSTLPLSGAQVQEKYEYYLLYGWFRPEGSLEAMALNEAEGLKFIELEEYDVSRNLQIVPTDDVIVLYSITSGSPRRIAANSNYTQVLKQLDTVWMEQAAESCGDPASGLSGTKIVATAETAIFSATAEKCNSPNAFSYDSTIAHQMPPVYKWGSTYIIDLLVLSVMEHYMESINVTFSILTAEEDNVVEMQWYLLDGTDSEPETYQPSIGKRLTVETPAKTASRYRNVYIKGSRPILLLFEIYSASQLYSSVLVQPVEWFSKQQEIVLSRTERSQHQDFFVSVTIPQKYFQPVEILIRNVTSERVTTLEEYDYFDGTSSNVEGYAVFHLLLDRKSLAQDSEVLTINHTSRCALIGATVFAPGELLSYGYSGGYVLESEESKPDCEGTDLTALKASICVGTAVALTLVLSAVAAIYLFRKRYKPNGSKLQYSYDVFLAYAEMDSPFAEECLYKPLTNQGYRVFFHHLDFIPGKTIAENIELGVRCSRRVLFVVTEHFVKSNYCRMELKYALDCQAEERARRVIPVVLDVKACPTELTYFNQVRLENVDGTTILNERDNNSLLKRLNLGEPVSELKSARLESTDEE